MYAPKKSLRCPKCRRKRLLPIEYKQVEIDSCIKCGGVYFDRDELGKCIDEIDSEVGQHRPPIQGLDGLLVGETDRICPHCYETLLRYQYAPDIQLHYDFCKSCSGIWLDREDLEHIHHAEATIAAKKEMDRETTFKDRIFQFITSLPVEFNIRPHRFPAVTVSLVFFNALFFLYFWFNNDVSYVRNYGLVPGRFDPTFSQWITSLFMHGGFMHLIGNMYLLYKLGDNVEDLLGHTKYLFFYIFAGLSGSLLYVLGHWESQIPMIGASGAVAGVMGAYLYYYRKAKLTFMLLIFQWKVSAYAWLGVWFLFNVISYFNDSGNVAWLAHIGGFLFGFGYAYMTYQKMVQKHPILKILNHHY